MPNEQPKQSEPEEDGIKRLQRELYSREEPPEITMRREELSQLGRPGEAKPSEAAARPRLVDVVAKRNRRHRKAWLIAGGVGLLAVLFVAAIVVTIQFRLSRQVKDDQIGIEIASAAEFTAGDIITYTLAYSNQSRVDWQNVELVFAAPEGFSFQMSQPTANATGSQYVWTIGDLPAKQAGEVKIEGRLIGEQNAAAQASAELFLTPENFPSGRFSRAVTFSTVITALPIDVSVEAVDSAAHGERVPVRIFVRNLSNEPVSNSYLKIAAQPGAQLAVEDEEFSPGFQVLDSEWLLPTLEPLGEVVYNAVVFVEGAAGERRPLDISVGLLEQGKRFVQRMLNHVVTITASELAVELVYNNSTEPQTVRTEQTITGLVRYKNTGSVGLRNVVVRLGFEGTGLNAATLKLEQGGYDPAARVITWSSATVPALTLVQPGQEGEIKFEFKVLPVELLPKTGENLSNLILISTAVIDSEDLRVPTGQERKVISDRLVLSLATNLTLEAAAFYDDGRLGLPSSGPLPPKVNETTTYSVRLRLGSTSNDVGEVRLTAVLPDEVSFTGQTVKTAGDVQFDDRSNEVSWTMPRLAALTGRTAPAEELYFQVAITPGENKRGDVIEFLNRLTVAGTDLFVDEIVTQEVKTYPSTKTADRDRGVVE